MTGDRSHHHEVSRTEHNILHHLSHHHSTAEIYREIHHLRAYDAAHGHNFKRDLADINHHLRHETARMHLPNVSIVEHGKNGFTVHASGGDAHLHPQLHEQKHQHSYHLPKAVQHDIDHEYHSARKRHVPHEPRFVEPRDAFSGKSRPSKDWSPPADDPNGSDQGGDTKMNRSSASPSKSGFGEALLHKLGLPVSQRNLDFLDKWQRAEGGSADNPFNTTQNAPGARNFNSVGVKRYPSMDIGLDATVKTLRNGHYNGILHALANEDQHAAASALRASPWGTKNIRV